MNALRITCKDGETKSLLIQSSLDRSYYMEPRTDEQVQFGRDDLVILKEKGNRPHTLYIRVTKTIRDELGEGVVIRSTRRGALCLSAEDDVQLNLAPGEVLQIRGMNARNPTGNGPGSTRA